MKPWVFSGRTSSGRITEGAITRHWKHYQKHGHLQVEAAAHPQLYRWMGKQRQRHKKKSISKRQIQLLDKLGFSCSEDLQKQWQMQWQQCYEQLLAFKQLHQLHEGTRVNL